MAWPGNGELSNVSTSGQTHKETVRWYRAAADQEDAFAQNNLGVMYEKGRGVSQDYILVHM